MPIRNVPTDAPARLADLVTCAPGRVSSRALTGLDDPAQAVLLAYAAGEGVSDETYPADALYLGVSGRAAVITPAGEKIVREGEALRVPAGAPHAVEARGDCSLLQLLVP